MKPIQLFDIKTRTLGFAVCQPPKESLPKSLTKKVTTKFQTQKKSSDGKFQTQKRASHIPVTYIPEYPPPPPGVLQKRQIPLVLDKAYLNEQITSSGISCATYLLQIWKIHVYITRKYITTLCNAFLKYDAPFSTPSPSRSRLMPDRNFILDFSSAGTILITCHNCNNFGNLLVVRVAAFNAHLVLFASQK